MGVFTAKKNSNTIFKPMKYYALVYNYNIKLFLFMQYIVREKKQKTIWSYPHPKGEPLLLLFIQQHCIIVIYRHFSAAFGRYINNLQLLSLPQNGAVLYFFSPYVRRVYLFLLIMHTIQYARTVIEQYFTVLEIYFWETMMRWQYMVK